MTGPESLPDCTHRPTCPGCPRYGEPGLAAATRQALERLAADSGAALDPPVEGRALGYRHRVRLMVRGRANSPKVGLFQSGTHRIADIPRCHVHHPKINEAAAALKRAMRSVGAEPYADGTHRGLVRALQVVVERSTQTLQVVVVGNGAEPSAAEPLLERLERELGASLHSLFWNGNPERSNTILGPHWRHCSGPGAVCEDAGGAQIFFPPGAFGQSHLELADQIVARIHDAIPSGARVAEFYAGCGAIGLGLLARGHEVAFNELNADSLRGLDLGIAALPPAEQARARRLPGAAGECADAANDCDVAVADPPRKGLDAALCAQLAHAPPQRFAYLSCDADSLQRDAAELLAPARLVLRRVSPFVLFPFTDHVETLAIFDRR